MSSTGSASSNKSSSCPPYDPKASHYKSPVRTMFHIVIDLVEYGKDDQDEVGQLSSDYKPTTIWPMVWHD